MSKSTYIPNPKTDLVLERVVDLAPEKLWAAWTTPEHLKNWFTPAPWKTIAAEVDLRPGGAFRTTFRSPEGQEFPNGGCFLEVKENERLVWTDALTPGFRPSERPFMTAIVSFEKVSGGTKYTAIAMHRDEEAKKQHEEMGFMQGWSTVLDQLVAYMKTIS